MRLLALFSVVCLALAPLTAADPPQDQTARQYYEVRTYSLGEKGDEAALDQYFRDALLPALERQGIGPVGVLHDPQAEAADRQLVLILPYDSPAQLTAVQPGLDADAEYQKAAAEYLNRPADQPAFARVSSELLWAFECMPQLKVPAEVAAGKDRLYELRVYESASERLGALKVDMFNNGEVPIFLDSGIRPVFFGQAIVGPQQPNLTYLTVYENDEVRQAGWKAFLAHPDWATLKATPKYANTVSKIHKHILHAKPYSQL